MYRQAGGGRGRSYSFYTRVDARQEEGQAGGGGPGRRARQRRAMPELQFLYK